MIIIKMSRPKIGVAVTCLSDSQTYTIDAQRRAVSNWNIKIPRVIVTGPIAPSRSGGVRHIQKTSPSLADVIMPYIASIPGPGAVFVSKPDVLIAADLEPILDDVESARLEMSWAARVGENAFILSTQVASQFIAHYPRPLKMDGEYGIEVDKWAKRFLGHRYIDATKYGILVPIPPPIPEMEDEPEEAPVKVKVRKGKK